MRRCRPPAPASPLVSSWDRVPVTHRHRPLFPRPPSEPCSAPSSAGRPPPARCACSPAVPRPLPHRPSPRASHLRHLRPEDTLRGTQPPARGRGVVRSTAPGVGPRRPAGPSSRRRCFQTRPLSRAAPAPPGSRDPSASAASVHFWPGAASRAALSPPVRLGGHGPCGAAVPAPQR